MIGIGSIVRWERSCRAALITSSSVVLAYAQAGGHWRGRPDRQRPNGDSAGAPVPGADPFFGISSGRSSESRRVGGGQMTKAYRVLAGLIALLVVVQAAAVAYGAFSIDHKVDSAHDHAGNTITNASTTLNGGAGFGVHAVIGQMVIPLIALLLVAVSFRAAVTDGKKWATLVLVDVIVQVALGVGAHSLAWLGWLHGPNALVLFALAGYAARNAALAGSPANRAATISG